MIVWRYFPVIYALPFLLATTQFSTILAASELTRWIVLLVAMGFAMRFGFRRMGQRRGRITYVDLVIISFLVIFMVSAIWSINGLYSFQKAISVILLISATFWTLWHYADRYSEKKLIDGLLFSIVTVLALNLIFGWFAPRPLLAGRFNGFFENPNNIGILTAIAGSILLVRWLARRRWIDLFALAIVMTNLILAGSRSALLAIAVVLALHIGRAVITTPLRGVLLLATIASSFLYLMQNAFFAERILRVESLSTGSNRLYFWDLAKTYIANRPMLGHGFGTDAIIHDHYGVILRELGLRGSGVMSSYYGAAVQVGIPVSMMIFVLLWGYVFYALTIKRRDFWSFHYAAIMAAGLIVSAFEPILFSAGNAFSFIFYGVFMLLLRRLTYLRRMIPTGPHGEFILIQPNHPSQNT
jgi:hypothetical protein